MLQIKKKDVLAKGHRPELAQGSQALQVPKNQLAKDQKNLW